MGRVGVGAQVPLVGRAGRAGRPACRRRRCGEGTGTNWAPEGEAGIGKSRLLAEVLGLARERGFRVFSGACDELEQDRPLRALGEALEVERGAPDPRRAGWPACWGSVVARLSGWCGSRGRPTRDG